MRSVLCFCTWAVDINVKNICIIAPEYQAHFRYGEEWEAYRDSGIITLLGLAFSRDQPKKVYIQDIMRRTLNEVVEAFISQKGSFYLCGPVYFLQSEYP